MTVQYGSFSVAHDSGLLGLSQADLCLLKALLGCPDGILHGISVNGATSATAYSGKLLVMTQHELNLWAKS